MSAKSAIGSSGGEPPWLLELPAALDDTISSHVFLMLWLVYNAREGTFRVRTLSAMPTSSLTGPISWESSFILGESEFEGNGTRS